MIAVTCSRCNEELTALGALAVSPPLISDSAIHHKFHLCLPCNGSTAGADLPKPGVSPGRKMVRYE